MDTRKGGLIGLCRGKLIQLLRVACKVQIRTLQGCYKYVSQYNVSV